MLWRGKFQPYEPQKSNETTSLSGLSGLPVVSTLTVRHLPGLDPARRGRSEAGASGMHRCVSEK